MMKPKHMHHQFQQIKSMKKYNSFGIVVQTEHQNTRQIIIIHDFHMIFEMKNKTSWKVYVKIYIKSIFDIASQVSA